MSSAAATMDDSIHSEAQLVLDKWTTSLDGDDDDLMMIDADDCDDCLPGIVSESECSESSSSSSSSSDMDDILMMKLDDEDGLLMDDLLGDDDDLQLLENVLSNSTSDDVDDDMILPITALSSSHTDRPSSSSSSNQSGDVFFSTSFLQDTPATTRTATNVLDERLQQTVLKLQESMRRSSETRQSLYARSSALSNYRRTHSVRQVLNNVEFTSKGVARSFSDPTPLSHMQNTLMR